jgi:hypothetical protein
VQERFWQHQYHGNCERVTIGDREEREGNIEK